MLRGNALRLIPPLVLAARVGHDPPGARVPAGAGAAMAYLGLLKGVPGPKAANRKGARAPLRLRSGGPCRSLLPVARCRRGAVVDAPDAIAH